MQGFPVARYKHVVENVLQSGSPLLSDLAGNAFGSLPVLSLLLAALVALPWRDPEAEEDAAELAACSAFLGL